MVDFNKIKEHETSMDYHKDQSDYWWRRYLNNLKMIRRLREDNRKLRKLNVTMKEVVNDWVSDYFEGEGE